MAIIIGRWTEKELEDLLIESSAIDEVGGRISFISRQFLGGEYKEATLQGSTETQEELVINLAAVDCFTFIDYIEAMRLSRSFAGFVESLRKVRYRRGEVSFRQRNHFFTDWREANAESVEDVTDKVGKGRTVKVQKMLNERADGGNWVKGIEVMKRTIDYIPSRLPYDVAAGIMTGDYVGVYSAAAGLDVSHVGIAVRDNSLVLRHASSRHKKVVDEDLQEYLSDKPGVIILRPKSQEG